MWNILTLIIHEAPELLILLSLGIGYLIGKRLKLFGVTLGPTVATLLTAIIIGQIDVTIPSLVKQISFGLFIFTIGYRVGPQFFHALKKEGIHYLWLGLITACTAFKVVGSGGTQSGVAHFGDVRFTVLSSTESGSAVVTAYMLSRTPN